MQECIPQLEIRNYSILDFDLSFIVSSQAIEKKKEATPLPILQIPGSNEQDEEEATPAMVEEAQPDTPEEQSPSDVVIEVLGALEPQQEVAESESADDKEGSNNVSTDIAEVK